MHLVVRAGFFAGLLVVLVAAPARADDETRVTCDQAIRAAQRFAPDLAVARERERLANAEISVAGTYPNPSVIGGSSTQAARISAGVSVPLVVFGQRGAAIDAARAERATAAVESQVTWVDIRWATTRAFIELWLAENAAIAVQETATLAAALEDAVRGRVQVGSAPELDLLRVHAERLSVESDATAARARVLIAAGALARFTGDPASMSLRAAREPPAPEAPPTLATLVAELGGSAQVRREDFDAASAHARADRERALVRPAMVLDLGVDALDPTLPATNLRAQLAVEVPIFNHRGGYVEREEALEGAARARRVQVLAQTTSDLTSAYRTYQAATERQKSIANGVLPAANVTAKAMREAYDLGRAPLVALLDAQRAFVTARLAALDAQATRASAWADVLRALGVP